MQQFDSRSISDADSRVCAALLVEVVPLLMRALRAEMRSRGAGLDVRQFRTLAFLSRRPGVSLSEVAEQLGLSLASTSKKVDGLVARQLVVRETSATDRRRVMLALSPSGSALFSAAREGTRESFAEALAALSADDHAAIARALRVLRTALAPTEPGANVSEDTPPKTRLGSVGGREDEDSCN